MTYELSRMFGTGRLAFLHGYATGMSKYDKPLSIEDVHNTAAMFMAELDAAIKEIERELRKRYAVVDTAYCSYGTCQQIRKQQGRDPLETVAGHIVYPQSDWYDPVPIRRDPSRYRDCYCDDHGDCQAIFRNNAWRCVICGNLVAVSEPEEA
jgi:hypothetical protein